MVSILHLFEAFFSSVKTSRYEDGEWFDDNTTAEIMMTNIVETSSKKRIGTVCNPYLATNRYSRIDDEVALQRHGSIPA